MDSTQISLSEGTLRCESISEDTPRGSGHKTSLTSSSFNVQWNLVPIYFADISNLPQAAAVICPVAPFVDVPAGQGRQVQPGVGLYVSGGQSVQDVNGAADVSPATQMPQAAFLAEGLMLPGVQDVQPPSPAVHVPA